MLSTVRGNFYFVVIFSVVVRASQFRKGDHIFKGDSNVGTKAFGNAYPFKNAKVGATRSEVLKPQSAPIENSWNNRKKRCSIALDNGGVATISFTEQHNLEAKDAFRVIESADAKLDHIWTVKAVTSKFSVVSHTKTALVSPGTFSAFCIATQTKQAQRSKLFPIVVSSGIASTPYACTKRQIEHRAFVHVESVVVPTILNGLWAQTGCNMDRHVLSFLTPGVTDGTYMGSVSLASIENSKSSKSTTYSANSYIHDLRNSIGNARRASYRIVELESRRQWLLKESKRNRTIPKPRVERLRKTALLRRDTVTRIFVPKLHRTVVPKPKVVLPQPLEVNDPDYDECTDISHGKTSKLPGTISLLRGSPVVHTSCDLSKLIGDGNKYERVSISGAQYGVLDIRDSHTFVLGDQYCGAEASFESAFGVVPEQVDMSGDWVRLPGTATVTKGSKVIHTYVDLSRHIFPGECIRIGCRQYSVTTSDGQIPRDDPSLKACTIARGQWVLGNSPLYGNDRNQKYDNETRSRIKNVDAKDASNGAGLKYDIGQYITDHLSSKESTKVSSLLQLESKSKERKTDFMKTRNGVARAIGSVAALSKVQKDILVRNLERAEDYKSILSLLVSFLSKPTSNATVEDVNPVPNDTGSAFDQKRLNEVIESSSLISRPWKKRAAFVLNSADCTTKGLVEVVFAVLSRNPVKSALCRPKPKKRRQYTLMLSRPWLHENGTIPAFRIRRSAEPSIERPKIEALPGAAFPFANVVTLSSCDLFYSTEGGYCVDETSVLIKTEATCNILRKMAERYGKLKPFCSCEKAMNECNAEPPLLAKVNFNGNSVKNASGRLPGSIRKSKIDPDCNTTVPPHNKTLQPEDLPDGIAALAHGTHGAGSAETGTKRQGGAGDGIAKDKVDKSSLPWNALAKAPPPIEKKIGSDTILVDPRTRKPFGKDIRASEIVDKRAQTPIEKLKSGQSEDNVYNGGDSEVSKAAAATKAMAAPIPGGAKCGNMDPWNPVDAICKMLEDLKTFMGPGAVIANWVKSLKPDINPDIPARNFGLPLEPPNESDGGASPGGSISAPKMPSIPSMKAPSKMPTLASPSNPLGSNPLSSSPSCPCATVPKFTEVNAKLVRPHAASKSPMSIAYVGANGPTYQSREYHGEEHTDGSPAYQYKIPEKSDGKSRSVGQVSSSGEHLPFTSIMPVPNEALDNRPAASVGDVSNGGFNQGPSDDPESKEDTKGKDDTEEEKAKSQAKTVKEIQKTMGSQPCSCEGKAPLSLTPPKSGMAHLGGVKKGALGAVAKAAIPGMPPLPPFLPAPTLPTQVGLIAMIISMSLWMGIPIVGQIAMATHMGMSAAVPMAFMPSGLLNPKVIPLLADLAKVPAISAAIKPNIDVEAKKKLEKDLKMLGVPGAVPQLPKGVKKGKCKWNPAAKRKKGLCPVAKCKKRKAVKGECLNPIFRDKLGARCCTLEEPSALPLILPPGVPTPKCTCESPQIKMAKNAALGAMEASEAANTMRFARVDQCKVCSKQTKWTDARLLAHEYDVRKIWNMTKHQFLHHLAMTLYDYGTLVRRAAPKAATASCKEFRVLNFISRVDALTFLDRFNKDELCEGIQGCKDFSFEVAGQPSQRDLKRATCADKSVRNKLETSKMQRPLQLCDLVQIGPNPRAVYRVMEVDKDAKSIRIDRPFHGHTRVEGLSIQLVSEYPAQKALQLLAERKMKCIDDDCIKLVEKTEEVITLFIGGKRLLQSSLKSALNSAFGNKIGKIGHPPIHCNPVHLDYENKQLHKQKFPKWKSTSWDSRNNNLDADAETDPEPDVEEIISGSKDINSPSTRKEEEYASVSNSNMQDLMQEEA